MTSSMDATKGGRQSEKERYSNSFGRGPQALRMTSSLDARGHYGWLHPWTPQREVEQGAHSTAIPCDFLRNGSGDIL
jgi:hypothetical protein